MPAGEPFPMDAPPPVFAVSHPRAGGGERGRSTPSLAWVAAWMLTGAAAMVGLVGILTIGILVLPLALLLLAGLAAIPRARSSAYGAVYGASLPFLLIAVLNLGGPIECPGFGTVYPGENVSRCVEKWNPIPWLAIALALAGMGLAAQIVARRRGCRELADSGCD